MDRFFKSLKGRKAHYSLKDTNKIGLLGMFLEKNLGIEISYEKFRDYLVHNYNFSFG